MWAFWKNQRACKFVEESVEGSGVYFYRNLHGTGEPPRDLTGGKAEEVAELVGAKKAATTTTATGGVSATKRRLSHSAQMTAKALPILVAE
jgi:omega-6 fatty acid desaturase (delta-12 desaturase)